MAADYHAYITIGVLGCIFGFAALVIALSNLPDGHDDDD